MEAKRIDKFSLAALFLVTGFCFLSFAMFLRINDGVNVKFLLWVGRIAFISGVFTVACILLNKKQNSDQYYEA